VASLIGLDGRICAPDFDLYNQAFGLLAFAYGHHVLGEDDARDRALALRSILTRSYTHPLGGFYEGLAGPARLPLRSNPHMHLLEAALAWAAVDGDPGWRDMADAIAKLCLDRFIDPLTGALREYFAADWSPAEGQEGQIAEPGHQYEWAFLLAHWAELTGRERPAAVSRLIAFADAHGVDPARGVAVNAVLLDGGVHDAVARLWPQTERLRAYTLDNGPDRTGRLVAAIAGLRRYLDTPTPGLWFDQLRPDDTFVVEPAPASSLYHIVGAVVALEARG
jgi:mannose-6-phosphate isomerase